MGLTKNETLYDLNNKLKDMDPGTLTTLGQTDYDVLEVFSSRMGGVLDGASDDGWHDKVRTGLTTAIQYLTKYIDEEKKSAEFIKGAVKPVSNFQKILASYVEEFDKYDAIDDKPPTMYIQEDGKDKIFENGRKRFTDEYISWSKNMEAYEKAIPALEEEALRLEQVVKNYFAAIDLKSHTINSSLYSEGDADIKIKYEEIFRQIADIPDDEYVLKSSTGIVGPDEDGYYYSKEEYEVHHEFPDGAKYDGERTVERTYGDLNGDGLIDEADEVIYTKVSENGTYTDADGNEYGYVHTEESDVIGLVRSHTELTNSDGDTVRSEDTERTAAYTSMSGIDTTEVNETVNDGTQTTETRTTTSTAGDNVYEEKVEIVTNNDAPETGVVNDGENTTEVYRDPDTGELKYRTTYVDKHGNTCEYSSGTIKEEHRTLTITYPDGRVEKMTVNPNNPIDEQRIMNKLNDARAQYYVEGTIPLGLRYMDLIQDGNTSIAGCWEDDGEITFTLE